MTQGCGRGSLATAVSCWYPFQTLLPRQFKGSIQASAGVKDSEEERSPRWKPWPVTQNTGSAAVVTPDPETFGGLREGTRQMALTLRALHDPGGRRSRDSPARGPRRHPTGRSERGSPEMRWGHPDHHSRPPGPRDLLRGENAETGSVLC